MSWDVSWQKPPATSQGRKKNRFSINHHDLRCFLKGSCHYCHFTPWNCFVAMFALWKKFIDPIHRAKKPLFFTLVDFRIERDVSSIVFYLEEKVMFVFYFFYYFLLFSYCFRGDVCVFYHSKWSLNTPFGDFCLSMFCKTMKAFKTTL